jgi:predicted RecB family nuclease
MKPNGYITASKLYDYLQCVHRPWRDVYGPMGEKSKETNPFVELLWTRGVSHEENVIKKLGEYLDLSDGGQGERMERTQKAMQDGVELLYQPVIRHEYLLGIPDLLRKQVDGTYIAVDIKSGRGQEGNVERDDESGPKLKKDYAVQLSLYTDILERLGHSNRARRGIIYDIDHEEVLYELNSPMGVRTPMTYWEYYQQVREEVTQLLANTKQNDPANCGSCKMCPWYESCKAWVDEHDDLSGLFSTGRSVRDVLRDDIDLTTVKEAQKINVPALLEQKRIGGKEHLRGVGKKTLEKIKRRAEILANNQSPVLYEKIELPEVSYELFFDIEDDPTQGFVYMHGVYERGPDGEKFVPFVASEFTPESEEQAWREFWEYIRSLPEDDWCLYYYSAHEKTMYKALAKQYPDVATLDDVEWLYQKNRAIDLYFDVILKHTDWALSSYSLKAIAQYLGFKWRDETPSGALSIEWYNRYLETKDSEIMNRIILYNEDDCKATMVIKDALVEMKHTN